MGILIGAGIALILICSSVASEPLPVTTVDNVDLKRYSGKWHEIARLPNRFQKDCSGGTTAEYSLLPGEKIRVINRCLKANGDTMVAEGIARRADSDGTNAKLKVRFAPKWLGWLPQVWGNYWIIDLDSDYSYAVVGDPSRKYLWILARTPDLDPAITKSIIENLRPMGFDVDRLIYSDF